MPILARFLLTIFLGICYYESAQGLFGFSRSRGGDDVRRVAPPTTMIPAGSHSRQPSLEVKHKPLRCLCEDGEDDDMPLCASNGITYRNLCRFDCAKSKVKRLRKVKEGPCSGHMTRDEFWKSSQ